MTTVYVAEKPSLAFEIAKAISFKKTQDLTREEGYFTIGDTIVTFVIGHVFEQAMPEAYDPKYKSWRLDDLPIIPENWIMKPLSSKKKQISVIKNLLSKAQTVVNAGDAGREGQLLVDEVLIELGWNPFDANTKRLWVQSVTRKDLIAAIDAMKPNSERKGLYESALCRSRADWLHGLNLTRLYTIKGRESGANQTISVGRVQSPTLKLICDRDRAIENFVEKDFYIPKITAQHADGSFDANYVVPEGMTGIDEEKRIVDRNIAQAICDKVEGKSAFIETYEEKERKEAVPLGFSLSQLQTVCSKKFGYSAKQVLDIGQSLYETHKIASYPRTDSRYLPTSMMGKESETILKALKSLSGFEPLVDGASMEIKTAIWNNSKVSDHHAIIPTGQVSHSIYDKLSVEERNVFDLIAKNFICQFYPPYVYQEVTTIVECAEEHFKATGRLPLKQGWKVVYSDHTETEKQNSFINIPAMTVGDDVSISNVELITKTTTPPKRFTDGSLIAAMSSVHKFVTEEKLKKLLKENEGLGTEATRAGMIETLISRSLIKREGKGKNKYLISTEVGRSVIEALPSEVTSPGLTAVWEGYLSKIVKGEIAADDFMTEQSKILRKRVAAGIESVVTIRGGKQKPKQNLPTIEGHGDACSCCSEGKMLTRQVRTGKHKGKLFLGCSNYPTCNHSAWPKIEIPKSEQAAGHGENCSCCDGKMLTRKSKQGNVFLGCSNYPKCPETKKAA